MTIYSQSFVAAEVLYILSLHDFAFCHKARTDLVVVQASSLNNLFACCAASLLGRSGHHAFHSGSLDVRGLVIAPELFVQS